MIKYFCDHCGKEIRNLNKLKEMEYGYSQLGCVKNFRKAILHADCLIKVHRAMNAVMPDMKLPVDKV